LHIVGAEKDDFLRYSFWRKCRQRQFHLLNLPNSGFYSADDSAAWRKIALDDGSKGPIDAHDKCAKVADTHKKTPKSMLARKQA
jgi:hypothetical protein